MCLFGFVNQANSMEKKRFEFGYKSLKRENQKLLSIKLTFFPFSEVKQTRLEIANHQQPLRFMP
jgi:hypothetical protein